MPSRIRIVVLAFAIAGALGAAFSTVQAGASSSVSAIARSHTFIDLQTSLTYQIDPLNNFSTSGVSQDLAWTSTLVRPDGATTSGGRLPPMNNVTAFLATSWKVTKGGIIFNLRKDAKSNFGHSLTAADVVWSMQRACAKDFNAQFYFGLINVPCTAKHTNIVKVLGPDEVEIPQTAPSRFTVGVFAIGNFQIVDSVEAKQHATAKDPWATKWMTTNTDGYGPYYINSQNFVPNQKIILQLNPNYWAKSSVYYTTVVEQYIPNTYNELALLQRGEASHAGSLSYTEFNEAKKSTALTTQLLPSGNSERVSFFLKFAPWQDVTVRQAISEAIDRNTIVKDVFGGDALVDCYPVPQTYTLPFKDPCDETYNPAQAKQLLAAAGYTPAHPLVFTMSTTVGDSGPYVTDEMDLIKSQLAAVGVTMNENIVADTNTYNTQDFPPYVSYSTTLDAGGNSFADGGLDEELLFNTDIYPDTIIDGVQGYTNPTMLQDVRDMLTTPSTSQYVADEKQFLTQFGASYMQANVVVIPQQVVSAKGIAGYAGYAIGTVYYDLLHPAA